MGETKLLIWKMANNDTAMQDDQLLETQSSHSSINNIGRNFSDPQSKNFPNMYFIANGIMVVTGRNEL